MNGRVQFVWEVRAVVLSALAGALAWVVATRLGLLPEWAVPAVAVGALALTTGYVRARFRLWRYEVRDDALYLERGVFTRVRTVVPLVRVQHTDTARNPVERTLGLASTVVYTAGSRGADVSVPGLTREDAESLQQLLKQLAVEAGDEDAV
ncbi:MAG: PH domain-containing protein [Halolamina sp.]